MQRRAGDAPRRVETEHFVVVHTSAEPLARAVARRLEAVYQAHVRFIGALDIPVRRPKHKLEVYCFANHEQFGRYQATLASNGRDVLGFYDTELNRSAFFDLDTHPTLLAIRAAVEQSEPARRAELQRRLHRRREWLWLSIIQHEAAHQVQFNIGLIPSSDVAPTWLAEGLATLFEVPLELSETPRECLNGYRLHEFRKLYGRGRETLGDLRRFLVDDEAWCGGKCYPLAWALTRHLLEEHREGFAALLRKVATDGGLPGAPAQRQAILDELLGPIDEAWIERFYTETMKLPLDSSTFAN